MVYLHGLSRPDSPANVFTVDHVQAAAVVPANHDGAGIIHTQNRTEGAGGRGLRIIHLHQLHPAARRIPQADLLDSLFT